MNGISRAEFRLLTIWRIEAPLDAVYSAIYNSLRWPDWWPGAQQVEQFDAGDAIGIDSVRRYCWLGPLPYRLVVDIRATRIETHVAIEGTASGDLEGTGRWEFSSQGETSIVRHEWHVRSTRWWMNVIAPLARPLFVRNHAIVMRHGGEGLARLLNTRLVGLTHTDLMAEAARRDGPIQPRYVQVALLAGFAAGIIGTAAQIILWLLASEPVSATLLRDTRLTAAIIMGSRVLPSTATMQWDIFLTAMLIHFSLAVTYAVIPAHIVRRLGTRTALLSGALYGLAIYVANLYGFVLIFPWFAVARGWVTILTHVIFGIALAAACKLCYSVQGRRA